MIALAPDDYVFVATSVTSPSCPGVCDQIDSWVWGVDVTFTPGVCEADFNGDGSVDFFDYDDFIACFESIACPPGADADFNDDGSVDFFDYDDFVLSFEVGC
jgi:hypothetical protein